MRRFASPGPAMVAVALVWSSQARAQPRGGSGGNGIFYQLGMAAQELGTAAGIILAAVGFTLGGGLMIYGGKALFDHYKGRGRGDVNLGVAGAALLAGTLILGVTGVATLSATTFTGQAPGIRNGTTSLTF